VCSGEERKCCIYSGRRGVIDYRVSVIDYQVKNNFPRASDRGYRISVIDYQGRNYFPGAPVRGVIDYRIFIIDYQG